MRSWLISLFVFDVSFVVSRTTDMSRLSVGDNLWKMLEKNQRGYINIYDRVTSQFPHSYLYDMGR